MTDNWQHNEGRPASMKDVEAILRDLSKGERSNPPVLALNNRNLMKARNNGYPMEMYHETLEPVFALNEAQSEKLMAVGYVTHYIPRHYPKAIFRHNPDPKFALRRDPATGEPLNHEFVEERFVKTAVQHGALKEERVPKGCGPWVEKLTDIEDLPDGPEDGPAKGLKRAA
ncbi:MAG TPA: hypothetical protein VIY49_29560 [Bryobacteraceae bacterium]